MEVNGLIHVRYDTLLPESLVETDAKVVETLESGIMTKGTECKCSLMEVNGLIQVTQDTLLLESGLETAGKVIERDELTRMTMGTE